MLPLLDKDILNKLDDSYTSINQLPLLLEQLGETYSLEILKTICWQEIYHQGDVYDTTIATIPHLVYYYQKATDIDFKFEAFIYVGSLIAHIANGSAILLVKSRLNKTQKETVKAAFEKAITAMKEIPQAIFELAKTKDDYMKRAFIAALAGIHHQFDLARVLMTFDTMEEYICVCPMCETDFYIQNMGNELLFYLEEPADAQEEGIAIKTYAHKKSLQKTYEWIDYYANYLEIKSFKAVLPYLFGSVKCPSCKQELSVFEGIVKAS